VTTSGPGDSPSLNEQIEILKQQLMQAQKLTALGELVSTTTHEFNNVLMTIINYAKLGLRHKDGPTREKAFEKILVAGNRAAKITNSVLGMARKRSPGQEATDLTALIENTLVLLEREMRALKRRCRKIIWLNPLLASEHYEPLCKGMQAALPYLDLFLSVHNLNSLVALGRTLQKLVA